jgi:hypothetical protein
MPAKLGNLHSDWQGTECNSIIDGANSSRCSAARRHRLSGATGGNASDRFPPPRIAAFRQSLKEEGYIDGQNVSRRT